MNWKGISVVCVLVYKDQNISSYDICRVSCLGVVNMLLVHSITFYFHFNIWGCMCSTGPFQYRLLKGYIYSSCYHHHQIGSIHFSHCYHIFPWLCVWDICYKLTGQQASNIFKARTRMLPVKNNYRNKYRNLTCRACGVPVETQKHVLEDCEILHPVGEYKVYNK